MSRQTPLAPFGAERKSDQALRSAGLLAGPAASNIIDGRVAHDVGGVVGAVAADDAVISVRRHEMTLHQTTIVRKEQLHDISAQ